MTHEDLIDRAKLFLKQNKPIRAHQAGGLLYELIGALERVDQKERLESKGPSRPAWRDHDGCASRDHGEF